MMKTLTYLSGSFWQGLMVFLLMAGAPALLAEDIKLDIRLLWGTNESKSPDASHKLVDAETAKKLGKVFKWKNYFEIIRKTETVTSRSTKSIKVSDKCKIEVTELEGPKVEVKLYGEGKLVNKSVKSLSKGEHFVLAGDDKNESAWFIMITQME